MTSLQIGQASHSFCVRGGEHYTALKDDDLDEAESALRENWDYGLARLLQRLLLRSAVGN